MKKVIIRAPLLSMSGYGVHSRQIFRWLLSKKDINVVAQIVPWGNTTWMLKDSLDDGLIGEIMKRSVADRSAGDVSIQVQLPNEWSSDIARVNVGVSACVETDVCNPAWIADCNRMSAVVVPSTHVRDVLLKTGPVNVPLHVVPESFHPRLAEPAENVNLDLGLVTDFNFLMVGQITGNNPWNDRKNTFLTLKWMCEAFSNDPNVGIILKTNSGRGTTIDRAHTKSLLAQVLTEVRKGPYPRVYLLHGNMTESEMSAVYKQPTVKAFVSLSRGEGFGLPILESAALGLPVITTNWSGQLDFMGLGKFIPVNYDLREIHPSRVDGKIFMQGSRWAEPDESDSKRKLLKFRTNPGVPQAWARDLQEVVAKQFSQSRIEYLYDQALGTLL